METKLEQELRYLKEHAAQKKPSTIPCAKCGTPRQKFQSCPSCGFPTFKDREKKPSRNPNGRPPSRFKIRHTSTNGGKVRQTTALTYNAAMLAGLDYLVLDETGEVEIEDRELDCTWRLV